MQRIAVLAGAILTLGLLASPLRAQQSDQSTPAAATPLPEAQQLPPPPPFPPMPSTRHRWVDVGDRHSSRAHHAAATHHTAASSHHKPTRAKTHAAKHSAKHKAKAAAPQHFSKRTVRQCHGMSYREIMHHSSCRALMSQELAASSEHHRTKHHAARKTAKHHSAKRHRR